MTPIPNPDSWADVITIVIVTLIVAGPTWIAARTKRQIGDVHRQVRAVRDHVVNGHTTPMRSDLDGMKTDLSDAGVALSNLRDEVRGGFASVRADLAEERSARRDGDMSLREEIRDCQAAVTQERTARQAGDQTLRDDLTAHRDDTAAHETR